MLTTVATNKTAVCFFGLPRGHSRLWRRLLDIFVDADTDLFVHTWSLRTTTLTWHGKDRPNDEHVRALLKICQQNSRLARFCVDLQQPFDPVHVTTPSGLKVFFSSQKNMFTSISAAAQLVMDYARRFHTSYDQVYFLRTDLAFCTDISRPEPAPPGILRHAGLIREGRLECEDLLFHSHGSHLDAIAEWADLYTTNLFERPIYNVIPRLLEKQAAGIEFQQGNLRYGKHFKIYRPWNVTTRLQQKLTRIRGSQ